MLTYAVALMFRRVAAVAVCGRGRRHLPGTQLFSDKCLVELESHLEHSSDLQMSPRRWHCKERSQQIDVGAAQRSRWL